MFNVKALCSIGANVGAGLGFIAGEGQRRTMSEPVVFIPQLDTSPGKI